MTVTLLDNNPTHSQPTGSYATMKNSFFFSRILALTTLLCLAFAAPALAADAKPAADDSALQAKLIEFGKGIADQYNRCVIPSKQKKRVEANGDGTFTATYCEIDPQSLSGSFKNAVNPKSPVKYIGTLTYAEVTYSCTAKSKKAAQEGPFTASRVMTTELVKYVNGKWSY